MSAKSKRFTVLCEIEVPGEFEFSQEWCDHWARAWGPALGQHSGSGFNMVRMEWVDSEAGKSNKGQPKADSQTSSGGEPPPPASS